MHKIWCFVSKNKKLDHLKVNKLHELWDQICESLTTINYFSHGTTKCIFWMHKKKMFCYSKSIFFFFGNFDLILADIFISSVNFIFSRLLRALFYCLSLKKKSTILLWNNSYFENPCELIESLIGNESGENIMNCSITWWIFHFSLIRNFQNSIVFPVLLFW